MAKGIKTGGRKKGTPNRRSLEIGARLATLDFDPTTELVKELKKPVIPTEDENGVLQVFCKDRAKILMGLHEYLYAKRKPLEETEDDGTIDITPDEEIEGFTDEELERIATLPKPK